MSDIILVLTSLPDRQSAYSLAQSLVENRLAACVNILPLSTSIYRWKGKVEEATETPLLIKTRAACYETLEAAICRLHPYETPEIIALPVLKGLPAFLDWVAQET